MFKTLLIIFAILTLVVANDSLINTSNEIKKLSIITDINWLQCIKAASEEFPAAKSTITKLIDDVQAQNWLAVIQDLKSLADEAKDLYNKCETKKFGRNLTAQYLGFPDWKSILRCLKAAAEEFPAAKSEITQLVNDIKTKNWVAVLKDVAALGGDAKTLYNKCKNPSFAVSTVPRQFGGPDWNKIIQCLIAAADEFPAAKSAVTQLVNDIKAKNWVAVLKDVSALGGDAKTLYNRCKNPSFAVSTRNLNFHGMPDWNEVIKCILAAIEEFPTAKNAVTQLINDIQSQNFFAAMQDVSNLGKEAKDFFLNKCKLVSPFAANMVQQSFVVPDWNQIVQCLKAAVEEFPAFKSSILQIISDVQAQNWMVVVKDVVALEGEAKDLFNRCKNPSFLKVLS